MIDNPDDLVREQARVDGMANGADAHDAVPGFQMTPRVPRDGGDAIAELDSFLIELLTDFQRARSNFGVIGPMYGTFDGSGDDFLIAMYRCRMVDNPMTQQGPVLHQSEH
jgi:hypothetical protein